MRPRSSRSAPKAFVRATLGSRASPPRVPSKAAPSCSSRSSRPTKIWLFSVVGPEPWDDLSSTEAPSAERIAAAPAGFSGGGKRGVVLAGARWARLAGRGRCPAALAVGARGLAAAGAVLVAVGCGAPGSAAQAAAAPRPQPQPQVAMDGQFLEEIHPSLAPLPALALGHTDDIAAIGWSPDGRQLASASLDGTVQPAASAGPRSRQDRGHPRRLAGWQRDRRPR
jgi:hypothetical protein